MSLIFQRLKNDQTINKILEIKTHSLLRFLTLKKNFSKLKTKFFLIFLNKVKNQTFADLRQL